MLSTAVLFGFASIALNYLPGASAHLTLWHPSVYGLNLSSQQGFDNRLVAPLMWRTFDKWWYHGAMDYPPHKNDVFEFKAGQTATMEIACGIGATSYYKLGGGGYYGTDSVCPNQPPLQWHTDSPETAAGTALAVADKANPRDVRPEDFTIFSTNKTSPWYRFTNYQVPAEMPKCTGAICQCAWFWIHRQNGAAQMYMTAFQCKFTNTKPNAPKIAKAQVARVCGTDTDGRVRLMTPHPKNCTLGAKQPLYWMQKEGNNIIADWNDPPMYNQKYGFKDGAQNDIFVTSQKQAREEDLENIIMIPASAAGDQVTDAVVPNDTKVSKQDRRMSGLYNKHHKRRLDGGSF